MLSPLHVSELSHSFAGDVRHDVGLCTLWMSSAIRIGGKVSMNCKNSIGRESKQRI